MTGTQITAELLKSRRTDLKRLRGGGYDTDKVNALLDFAVASLTTLEAQVAELEQRDEDWAHADAAKSRELAAAQQTPTQVMDTVEDERTRVMRAAMAQQAGETIIAAAEQQGRVIIQAARVQGERLLDEAHRRVATVEPAAGLPARPEPTGDQVNDALLQVEWIGQMRSFLGNAAQTLLPQLRDAKSGLERAEAALTESFPALAAPELAEIATT
jgi:cell division septum initiation protein DivIVA